MQRIAFNTFIVAFALCAALVAACGRDSDRDIAKDVSRGTPPPQPTTSSPAATPTPANLGQPSQSERQEGRNPQQGQVDPKEPEQRKDFEKPG